MCQATHLGRSSEFFFASLKGHAVSVTLNERSLKQPGFLLRADLLSKLSNWLRRALVRVGTKNLMVTLVELHDHLWRWSTIEIYKRTNTTETLHRSGLYGGVANLNHLLSEDKRKHTYNLQKKEPIGPSDSEKQDYMVWWTSILSIVFEGNQHCSSPAEDHPKSKVCRYAVFQQQGLKDSSE